MPRSPLKCHDVEMVVRERQLVHVADHAVDPQSLRLSALPPDLLHVAAAVDRVDLDARFTLEQRDPHGIGAGTNIQRPLPGSRLDGAHESVQETTPQPQAREAVRAIVVGSDVGEDLVQLLRPDRSEAFFARHFARGQGRQVHLAGVRGWENWNG